MHDRHPLRRRPGRSPSRQRLCAALVLVLPACQAIEDAVEPEPGSDEAIEEALEDDATRNVDPDLSSEEEEEADEESAAPTLELNDYAETLSSFVDEEGRVHYAALRTRMDPLNRYLASVGALERATYDAWNEGRRIAFWINAYNAYVMRSVVDHHPIEPSGLINRFRYPNDSVRQVGGFFDEERHPVMGRRLTLDDMKDALEGFGDPRVHLALVCGTVSCPPLRMEPYLEDALDDQLDDQARRLLADRRHGAAVDTEDRTVEVSRIFQWYGDEFEAHHAEGVAGYIAEHAPPEVADALDDDRFERGYLDFDWALNKR